MRPKSNYKSWASEDGKPKGSYRYLDDVNKKEILAALKKLTNYIENRTSRDINGVYKHDMVDTLAYTIKEFKSTNPDAYDKLRALPISEITRNEINNDVKVISYPEDYVWAINQNILRNGDGIYVIGAKELNKLEDFYNRDYNIRVLKGGDYVMAGKERGFPEFTPQKKKRTFGFKR